MTTLADVLSAALVELHPAANTGCEAIRETADLLLRDLRVLVWDEVYAGMCAAAPCLCEQHAEFGICIPHVRTGAVTALTMSVGRFTPELRMDGVAQPIRYIFCIAAPHALESDYLRIVGLLMRIVKDPRSEEQIRTAATAEEFVETLVRLEAKL